MKPSNERRRNTKQKTKSPYAGSFGIVPRLMTTETTLIFVRAKRKSAIDNHIIIRRIKSIFKNHTVLRRNNT